MPLKVLVADDNPVNLRVATRILKELGYTGALVTDGEKALKALASQPFDLCLMDVTMPVLDGLTALSQLRAHEKLSGQHMAVIMVTAHDLPSDRVRMLAAGADGYIAKPLDKERLIAEIDLALAATPRR